MAFEGASQQQRAGQRQPAQKSKSTSARSLPAGDRRLWASGSWGDRPTYFPQRVLIAAPADKRLRLLDAFRAAQAHALRLADEVTKEAAQLRGSGHGRQAANHDFEARTYREFAESSLI